MSNDSKLTSKKHQKDTKTAKKTFSLFTDEQAAFLGENIRQYFLSIQNESDVKIEGLYETRDLIIKEVHEKLAEINNIADIRLQDEFLVAHHINVALVSTAIAVKMSLRMDHLKLLTLAALVHDSGKVKIPKQVLLKSGELTRKEQELIKLHVLLGFKILKDEVKMEPIICRALIEHHERYDSSGYPYAIPGQELHIFSQIISVADVFDNLSHDLNKNIVKSPGEIVKMMLKDSKTFHPQVLYTLIHMVKFTA